MRGKSQGPNQLQSWTYVLIQAVLLILLFFFKEGIGPQINRFLLPGRALEILGVLGLLICAATLRKSLTVMPIPKEDGKLSTTGLYRFVRHPMYTSLLLLVLGIALHSGSVIKYLLVIFLYLLLYLKSVLEEKYLNLKFSDYAEYSARIPRFVAFTK